MKTIKNETYKGYTVKVFAEFKESTTAYMYSDTSYDSVSLLAYAEKHGFRYFTYEDSIEKKSDKHTEMYADVNKEIASMMENIKKNIDKAAREKEMTEGLPESLLGDEKEKSVEVVFELKGSTGSIVAYSDGGMEISGGKVEVSKEKPTKEPEESKTFNVNIQLSEGSSTRAAHSIAKEIEKRLREVKFQ